MGLPERARVKPEFCLPRRTVLAAALYAVSGNFARAASTASLHRGPGFVSPSVAVSPLAIVLNDATHTDLATLMRGRVTALQFVLTGCSSICPILGAIFAGVQIKLGATNSFQLVSISLDPEHDTPQALTAWLAKFGAGPAWRGAIPQAGPAGVKAMLQDWGLNSGTSSVFHTQAVLLVDRGGNLVFRSADLPDAGDIARLMHEIAQA